MKTKIVTSDIYFVAALLTLGAKIDETDKTDPRHIKFTVVQELTETGFASPSIPANVGVDFEYYEKLWANGQMVVNALSFKNAIQQVRTLIHST